MDRYVVLDYLAEGGMGAIYLGKKLGAGGFEKEVVLKQLLPEFTEQEEFIDLFLREAKLSATLDHANIVHTIDLVRAADQHFIVMEYIRGGDLRTILKRIKRRKKSLSPAAALFIAREVLSALAYAHVKRGPDGQPLNLIHRDVSPSNVLVSGGGEVKLTDFGIAKASTHHSVFYKVKGKVGYMSPEQAKGEALDHRADVYSVAVALYEMLSGQRLFVSVGLTTSADEMYSQPIAPISRIVKKLPPELDDVMRKALAVNRDERYQSAGAMQDALLRVAHRNKLLMTAPELSAHLLDVCGDVAEWGSVPAKERGDRGTQQIDPGTAQIQGTSVIASSDEPDAMVGGPEHTHAIPQSADAPYLEDSGLDMESDVWRAVSHRPGLDRLTRDEARRRLGTQPDRIEGLELTSVIAGYALPQVGDRPLVDLEDLEDDVAPAPAPEPARVPLAELAEQVGLRAPTSQGAQAPAQPRAESRAATRERTPAPVAEAPAPRAPSRAPTRAATTGPRRFGLPLWVTGLLLIVLGIGIALAIGLTGPEITAPAKLPIP